jgi:hypothetical protein
MTESELYRTKTGRILTEEELEELAAEAERGYDVEELAKQPHRRRFGPVKLSRDE